MKAFFPHCTQAVVAATILMSLTLGRPACPPARHRLRQPCATLSAAGQGTASDIVLLDRFPTNTIYCRPPAIATSDSRSTLLQLEIMCHGCFFRDSCSLGLDQGAAHIGLALADDLQCPDDGGEGFAVPRSAMLNMETTLGKEKACCRASWCASFPAACAEDHLLQLSRACAQRSAMMTAAPALRLEALIHTEL